MSPMQAFMHACESLHAIELMRNQVYMCEPFAQCHASFDSGVRVIEMLFSSSLVAIVGAGNLHSLPLQHTLRASRIVM